MLPSFLIPEQTLINKITKLIEAFQKIGHYSAKNEILEALRNAKKTLLDIEKKYKDIYTKEQLNEISLLHNAITKQSTELLRLQTEVLTSVDFLIAGITPGATEEETLQNFFERHCTAPEEDTTSESEDEDATTPGTPVVLESLENNDVIALDIDPSKIPLLNNIIILHKQTRPLEKKQDTLDAAISKFDRLLLTHDHRLQHKREREIQKAIENLVSAIHTSQEKNAVQKNDLGIIQCFEQIQSGPAAIRDILEKILAQHVTLEEKLKRFMPQSLSASLLTNEEAEETVETDLSDEDDNTSYTSEEDNNEEAQEDAAGTPPSSPAGSCIVNASSLFKTRRAEDDKDDEENRFDKKRRMA